MKRITTVLAAAAMLFGGGLASLPSASASASASAAPASTALPCTYSRLQLPKLVVVTSPARIIPAKVASDCSGDLSAVGWMYVNYVPWVNGVRRADRSALYATWGHPMYPQTDWIYPPTVKASDPMGTWTYRVVPGTDGVATTPTDSTGASTKVLLGSRSQLSATRVGSTVTFTGAAQRYASSLTTWIPWANTRGVIQYKSGSSWITVANVVTDSRGRVSAKVTSTSRTYHLAIFSSPYTWCNWSAPVTR